MESGSLGAASSESAAGSGRLRAYGSLRLFLRAAAVESVAVSAVARSCGCVVGFGWMVVRFVRVIRVPACARVSRVSCVCPGSPPLPGGVMGGRRACVLTKRSQGAVCPSSPRCLFTGNVCPVCVPAPPGVFLTVPGTIAMVQYCTRYRYCIVGRSTPQSEKRAQSER